MVNEKKIDIIRKSKPFSIFDIIVISSALILAIAYIIITLAIRQEGSAVKISIIGRPTQYYSLKEDRRIELEIDQHNMTIVIKDNQIYVENAECNDKTCVKTGKIRYSGEWIACTHLKVFILIEGKGLFVTSG